MSFDGFQMPPALAGNKNTVSADSDGASNFVAVTGGLTVVALAGTLALATKDRLMNLSGLDADSQATISLN